MSTSKASERRRAPRVRADLPLTLTDSGARARLKDISTVGLCCTSKEPISELTKVRIRLELNDAEHEVEGAVVRCEPEPKPGAGWEVAVYFTDIDDGARRGLGAWIDERIPRSARPR